MNMPMNETPTIAECEMKQGSKRVEFKGLTIGVRWRIERWLLSHGNDDGSS